VIAALETCLAKRRRADDSAVLMWACRLVGTSCPASATAFLLAPLVDPP
jgi:hypothetical protein